MRRVPDLASRPAGTRPPSCSIDLDSARLPSTEAITALKADPSLARIPVVGFFSHVHAGSARSARELGCSRVLPRSAFVQECHAPPRAGRGRRVSARPAGDDRSWPSQRLVLAGERPAAAPPSATPPPPAAAAWAGP